MLHVSARKNSQHVR